MIRGDPHLTLELVDGAGGEGPIDLKLRDDLAGFEYTDRDHGLDECRILLVNKGLRYFDDFRFAQGQKLRVAWGWGGRTTEPQDVVIHRVTGFRPLSIECRAQAVALDRGVKLRNWERMTAADIATQIADEWGYSGAYVQVDEPSGAVFECLTQHATDARFVAMLAKRAGCVFYCNATGFHFHRRNIRAVPTRALWYRTDPGLGDIIDIVPDSDFSRAVGKVTVSSTDPTTGQPVVAACTYDTTGDIWWLGDIGESVPDPAAAGDRIAQRNASEVTRHIPGLTAAQAQVEAERRLALAAAQRFVYRIQCVGDPDLRAAAVYELKGLPDMLVGNVYSKIAKHTIADGTYGTELTVIRGGPGAGVNSARAPAQAQELQAVETYVMGADGYPERVITYRWMADEVGMSVEGGGQVPAL